MSSDLSFSLSRRAALLGLLGAAGCGFTPVYGPSGQAAALQGQIDFETAGGPFNYRLREQFERRLGRADSPRFILKAKVDLGSIPVAIAADNTATRFNLPASAQYQLVGPDGSILTQGTVETFTSYSATGSSVANRTAKQAAEDRLAVMVADLIIARLLAETETLAL